MMDKNKYNASFMTKTHDPNCRDVIVLLHVSMYYLRNPGGMSGSRSGGSFEKSSVSLCDFTAVSISWYNLLPVILWQHGRTIN